MIASVSDYTLFGKVEGYEVTITPSVAASGLVLRVTHLDELPDDTRPSVGTPVRAGVTELGRVRDFSGVAQQEISRSRRTPATTWTCRWCARRLR